MTWKEFIEWAKQQGVKDSDDIRFIDFDGDPEKVTREKVTEEVDEITIS